MAGGLYHNINLNASAMGIQQDFSRNICITLIKAIIETTLINFYTIKPFAKEDWNLESMAKHKLPDLWHYRDLFIY